jgi:hypothetical protein
MNWINPRISTSASNATQTAGTSLLHNLCSTSRKSSGFAGLSRWMSRPASAERRAVVFTVPAAEGGEHHAGIHAADAGRVAGRRGPVAWIGLSASDS